MPEFPPPNSATSPGSKVSTQGTKNRKVTSRTPFLYLPNAESGLKIRTCKSKAFHAHLYLRSIHQ